jgi:Notch-like protein
VGPGVEVCNLLDDDCDGYTDEEDDCPPGTKCIDGQCATPCGAGEFTCPQGYICKNDYCVKDPCDADECGTIGGVCKAGVCIDPCAGKECTGKYEKCIKGACVDTSCYNPANKCPPGQACVQGVCQEDPCDPAKVSCGPDTYCVAGQCVPLCDCAPDELCVVVEEGGKPVGKCIKDACAGLECGEGRICQDGICVDDPCYTLRCETGEVCIDGSCVADPCETIRCPLGFVCSGGTCVVDEYAGSTDLLATGSGGLACELGPAGAASTSLAGPQLALAALLLVVALRRRRRRK